MGNSVKKTHNHPQLKQAKQYNYNGQQSIKKGFLIFSEQQFNEWQKNVAYGPASQTDYSFIPLLKNKKDDEKRIHVVKRKYLNSFKCSDIHQAEILFPAYWTVLSDQLTRIRSLQENDAEKTVEERFIWYLLKALSQVASLYHQSSRKLGDIRPHNILLSDPGQLKVITQDSWPSESTNYEKTVSTGQATYLAPQQQHQVIIGYKEQTASYESGQAFSIGLTCMECVMTTLQKQTCSQLYQPKQQLNIQKLEQKINDIKNNGTFYSQLLIQTIISLLQVNSQKRVKPIEIFKWLKDKNISKQNIQNLDNLLEGCPKQISDKLKNKRIQSSQVKINPKKQTNGQKINHQLENQESECENINIDSIIKKQSQKQENQTDKKTVIKLRPNSFWSKPQKKSGKRVNSKTLASFY